MKQYETTRVAMQHCRGLPRTQYGTVFEAGESSRFELKGHDPIFPEFPPMYRSMKNQNLGGMHIIHTGKAYLSQLMVPLMQ